MHSLPNELLRSFLIIGNAWENVSIFITYLRLFANKLWFRKYNVIVFKLTISLLHLNFVLLHRYHQRNYTELLKGNKNSSKAIQDGENAIYLGRVVVVGKTQFFGTDALDHMQLYNQLNHIMYIMYLTLLVYLIPTFLSLIRRTLYFYN